MVKKTEFFDAQFEYETLVIQNKSLQEQINANNKTFRNIILSVLFVVLGLFVFDGVQFHKTQKNIAQLQEDVMLLECEKDAAKYGAGFAFIGNGEESECQILYSD